MYGAFAFRKREPSLAFLLEGAIHRNRTRTIPPKGLLDTESRVRRVFGRTSRTRQSRNDRQAASNDYRLVKTV